MELYVVTQESEAPGRSHVDVAAAALAGGADAVQFRDKEMPARRAVEVAARIVEIAHAREPKRLCIVNDRVDIAIAAGADGVHLGQDDLPVGVARSMLGPYAVIGASVSSLKEAVQAAEEGADYLGVGSVFFTATKPDIGEPVGLAVLREIRERCDLPVVAIGGIGKDNIEDVLRAGASGVAVVSAVTAAADMREATRELRDIIDGFLSEERMRK